MAYDQDLSQRIREALADQDGMIEKATFGGLVFLLYGTWPSGSRGDELMVPVGPDALKGLGPEGPRGRRSNTVSFTDRGILRRMGVEPPADSTSRVQEHSFGPSICAEVPLF
jgi:hypothetical protein